MSCIGGKGRYNNGKRVTGRMPFPNRVWSLFVSRSLSPLQAIVLALVVLAGLVLGTAGLFAVGSKGWLSDAFRVRASFPDINGVEVGTRVRLQGMDAGEVEAIEMPSTPGQPVLLQLRLAGKFRPLVNKSSRVQLGSETFLSGKVVCIVPGATIDEPVEEHTILASDGIADLSAGLNQAASKLNSVLDQADSALAEFRRGEGAIGQVARDLSKAAARLDQVVAKVDAAINEVQQGKGTLGKLLKDEKLYTDLAGTIQSVKLMLEEVQRGEGTLGKLVKGNEVYAETLRSLQEMRQLMTSVKQNSDAIKAMPVVRNYVVDHNKVLIRPDCKRHRLWFPEHRLFEPGKAVLTPSGRQALDSAAQWLNDHKEEGSEVVVVSFAAPNQQPDYALTLTQKQSEVVLDYLRTTHRIHRTGFWWWSTRPTRALGCGINSSPVPEKERLPPARIELIVFVPQG